ncbi:hypothetical protein BKG82_23040 [Mycobacteroides chelonae]|uniref:Uncharacterized protein n=1 Tax=Mycobacteroides chelonae TaxID=1774 RepID=A0A1S1LME4_MYCCH|nr:hypothetical protein BKG82_23040 [Mycobacteroides chelonae]
MARTFPTCGIWIYDYEVRLWIGDYEGSESEPLSDTQIDSLIRNLEHAKTLRGHGQDLTWVLGRESTEPPKAPSVTSVSEATGLFAATVLANREVES